MRKHYDLDSLAVPGNFPEGDVEAGDLTVLPNIAQRPKDAEETNITTLLVEPNALVREGLKRILADTAYRAVVPVSSLEDVRRMQVAQETPLLLVVNATGNHAALCQQIQRLKQDLPAVHVAMLVDDYDLHQVLAAFQAGADAYLTKTVSCEVLVKTLDLVMLGETVFPSAVLNLVREYTKATELSENGEEVEGADERMPPKGLSVRETVILRCLMEGDSNKLIARKFDITEATVKVHVKAILRKIRAKNRTQAAIWAASHLSAPSRASTG